MLNNNFAVNARRSLLMYMFAKLQMVTVTLYCWGMTVSFQKLITSLKALYSSTLHPHLGKIDSGGVTHVQQESVQGRLKQNAEFLAI